MKECEAPESNNTNTWSPNNKQKSSIRLLDWATSVLVKAKTRPAALGLSDEDGYGRALVVVFLLGHLLTKCIG